MTVVRKKSSKFKNERDIYKRELDKNAKSSKNESQIALNDRKEMYLTLREITSRIESRFLQDLQLSNTDTDLARVCDALCQEKLENPVKQSFMSKLKEFYPERNPQQAAGLLRGQIRIAKEIGNRLAHPTFKVVPFLEHNSQTLNLDLDIWLPLCRAKYYYLFRRVRS